MPLDWQTAQVDFGAGIDTKTDPKIVVPAKFLDLKDAVFTKAKQSAKRNGYDDMSLSIIGGGTISNPKMAQAYGDRLVCADGTTLYEYSPTANKWRSGGKYDSIAVSNSFITSGAAHNGNGAILGNYLLTAADNPVPGGTQLYYSVVDTSNNSNIVENVQIPSGGTSTACPRVVVLGGTQLAIAYYNTVNGLVVRTVTISGSGVALGSEVIIGTDIKTYNTIDDLSITKNPSYDFLATSTGGVIAYSSSVAGNPIKFATIDTACAITHTATVAAAGLALPINLTVSVSNGNVWCYYGTPSSDMLTTATSVNYLIMSSVLSVVLGKTVIETGLSYVRQVHGVESSATVQTAYYSQAPALPGTNSTIPNTSLRSASVNSTGTVGTPSYYKFGIDMYGRSFTKNGKTYLPCVYYSSSQFNGYLIDLSDGHVAGKFLRGSANAAVFGLTYDPAQGDETLLTPGYLSPSFSNSAGLVGFISGTVIDFFREGDLSLPIIASCAVYFDWANKDALLGLNANGVLLLNGSLVSIYDGSIVAEAGFNAYPEIDYTATGAGGHLPAGTYQYAMTYSISDNQGNLVTSGVSNVVTVTVTGTVSRVAINTTVPSLTQWQKISVNLYRTEANGTELFLILQTDVGANYGLNLAITDVGYALAEDSPLYTSVGNLNNIAPPSSMVMWMNNNRPWLVDSENPETDVYYAKTLSRRNGINFSDELLYSADGRLGKITAGVPMDEKTILLKDQGLMAFVGDGASDTGQNSSLTPTQIIPSDVGGYSSKSVKLLPSGVIFQASNHKGIYAVSRGLQVGYFGSDVEDYNSQNIQAIEIIGDKSQVRILSDSGSSLLYDYVMNQWGTFTNHLGVSSTIWLGTYVYVRSDGKIYKENASTFLDGSTAYSWRGKTSWIKASVIQGLERIRVLELLGSFTGSSSHAIKISMAYDFGPTFTATNPYYMTSATGIFQFQAYLPRQKANAIQFLIEEITTGASGESVQISNLGLEIGLKKGLNTLPSQDSVG